jgi:hypothetical protein
MGDWTLYADGSPVRTGLTRMEIEGGTVTVAGPNGPEENTILGLLEMNAGNPDVYALGPNGERLPEL